MKLTYINSHGFLWEKKCFLIIKIIIMSNYFIVILCMTDIVYAYQNTELIICMISSCIKIIIVLHKVKYLKYKKISNC